MAKFEQGINGPFSGKVGNVIGSNWRGITYMKSVYKKRTRESTPKQKVNQYIFNLSLTWLQPIVDYVRQGFNHETKTTRGFIAARSYLLKNAMVRNGYDSYIDPARMLLSRGTLPMASDLSMDFDSAAAEINFRWNPRMHETLERPSEVSYNDQLMYVAYDIEAGVAYGELFGPIRRQGHCRLSLPDDKKATYHIYVAFHSADRKDQSDSLYLGPVEVAQTNRA
jgi:hypothetical protein